MSQEDIYEVQRLERAALKANDAQMQDPTWRELTEGYIQRNSIQLKALEKRLAKLEEIRPE